MTFWSKIVAAAQAAFDGDAVAPSGAGVPEVWACAPDPGDVGFTAAVIGLAAKMARADGDATASELQAAATVFQPPPGEEAAFRRAYMLAQETVLGFESYARQIGKKYKDRPCLLEDVLDGLFHIAAADRALTAAEIAYLRAVSDAFGFPERTFARIRATHLGPETGDPYAILGLSPDATLEEARQAWRRLAADAHPDQMLARGAPDAFVRLAHEKTATLNEAFARIRALRREEQERDEAPV